MATFTNRATLSFNGGTVDSNTVTGTFLETLAITKTATPDTYTAGSCVTYVISLVNSGSAPFTGLSLTDDLGAYDFNGTTVYPLRYVSGSLLYYVNGALQPTPTVSSTEPLIVEGISVPAGGNTLLIYTTNVSESAPPIVGGEVTNTATVSGGGLPEALTDSETITTQNAPELGITKSLTPTSVPENGSITYTFQIENRGACHHLCHTQRRRARFGHRLHLRRSNRRIRNPARRDHRSRGNLHAGGRRLLYRCTRCVRPDRQRHDLIPNPLQKQRNASVDRGVPFARIYLGGSVR